MEKNPFGVRNTTPGLKQTDPWETALSWLLWTRTTRRNGWIAGQLGGGHPSFITRAVRQVRTPETDSVKKALLEYLDCPPSADSRDIWIAETMDGGPISGLSRATPEHRYTRKMINI